MSNLDTLKQELLNQKSAIEEKGGSVNISSLNPSPSEITSAIASIPTHLDNALALIGDKTKTLDNSLISSTTAIRDYAFYGMENSLQGSVTLKSGMTKIPAYAFYNTWLESYTLPDTITSIGQSAFANCSKLNNLTIPDQITSVGSTAFLNCSNVKTIYIGSGISSILANTIKEIPLVTTLIIPENIKSIASFNLYKVDALENLYLKYNALTIQSSSIFATYKSTLKIWVNFEALSYFRTATNWSKMYTHFISSQDMTAGEAFPTVSGVSLKWFATIVDADADQNAITAPEATQTYYCKYSA